MSSCLSFDNGKRKLLNNSSTSREKQRANKWARLSKLHATTTWTIRCRKMPYRNHIKNSLWLNNTTYRTITSVSQRNYPKFIASKVVIKHIELIMLWLFWALKSQHFRGTVSLKLWWRQFIKKNTKTGPSMQMRRFKSLTHFANLMGNYGKSLWWRWPVPKPPWTKTIHLNLYTIFFIFLCLVTTSLVFITILKVLLLFCAAFIVEKKRKKKRKKTKYGKKGIGWVAEEDNTTYWLVSSCTISCWPHIESIGSTIPCLHFVWKLHTHNNWINKQSKMKERDTYTREEEAHVWNLVKDTEKKIK